MWHYSDPLRTSTLASSTEKFLDSSKGDFTKLHLLKKPKEKTKVSFQGSGPFAYYLRAPLLDISRMHKEGNIQAVVSTSRPNLVVEEKARDQLERAVEFHHMFYQAADFLSKLQEGTTLQEQGSIPMTLKNFASYFSLCSSSLEIYFQRIGISIVGKTILTHCNRATNRSAKVPVRKAV